MRARSEERAWPTGTVTFFFTDVEGSTRLTAELGKAYEAAQALQFEILRAEVSSAGGVEVGTAGDSLFCVFARAPDALRAAVGSQRALGSASWPGGTRISVRMGLHTGEGRLGREDYVGMDVNVAARIAAAASGGQVVLSDATRALTDGSLPEGTRMRSLGKHALKGVSGTLALFDLEIDGLPSQFPPLKTQLPGVRNLPARLTSFVGRAAEIEAVIEALSEFRLVTLTGPGGAGKTRLATEIASKLPGQYEAGVIFVDLSALRDPAMVPGALLRAAGLRQDTAKPAPEALAEAFGGAGALLVLDNFEQVIEAAPLVSQLLHSSPESRVLATSRIPLRVPGECEFAVPPLPADAGSGEADAVVLFLERARARLPTYDPQGPELGAIFEICRRLDGLPLAIELAASRIKFSSAAEILEGVSTRMDSLRSDERGVPERQRSLAGAVAWSHDLLGAAEAKMFARLWVFSGAEPADIDAVINPGGELGLDTFEGLRALTEQSLVEAVRSETGRTRFRMLETIRDYARSLGGKDDQEISLRHARRFADIAADMEPRFMGQDLKRWLDRCEEEHDNFRAALEWAIGRGHTAIAQRLASSLWRFWHLRGYLKEGRHWLDRALLLPGPPDALRARTHIAAGGVAYWQAAYDPAERHYAEAARIAGEISDRSLELDAGINMAWIPLVARGEQEAAVARFQECAVLADQLGADESLPAIYGGMAFALRGLGNYQRAIAVLEKAHEVAFRMGNRFWITNNSIALGSTKSEAGDLKGAASHFLEALNDLAETGDRSRTHALLLSCAGEAAKQKLYEEAARLWAASVEQSEKVGTWAPKRLMSQEGLVADLEAALGPETFGRIVEEGKAMTFDETLELGRGVLERIAGS